MNFHSLIEYLKYRWHALGRHGTHSPFVYDFVERVLQRKDIIGKEWRVVVPALELRYENIVSRMAEHYQYRHVVQLPGDLPGGKVDMILLDSRKPADWASLFDSAFALLQERSAVVIAGIHNSAEHTAAWNALRTDPRVRMNIDMYGMGVLLFRPEFKVPQGFVLKDTH